MVAATLAACGSAPKHWSQSNGLPMTVSLGVSQAPRDGNDLMTLLSVADIHLYQNKSQRTEAGDAPTYPRTLINEPEATRNPRLPGLQRPA